MISNHTVEVAYELNHIENIDFQYMETVFENDKPANSSCSKKVSPKNAWVCG
jgi:hypothetical protein